MTATPRWSACGAAPLPEVRVGVGDYAARRGPHTLVTYGLGSCVAVSLVDGTAGCGGLLHFMLPRAADGAADSRPAMFADTGLDELVAALEGLGAGPRRLRAKLVGGAAVSEALRMNIGQRNVLAAKRLLWRRAIPIDAEEVGGNLARTVHMQSPTGRLRVLSPQTPERIL